VPSDKPRGAPPTGPARHSERHRVDRIGWLRAAVLGANDGIVSTSSLLVGVAASNAARSTLLIAGTAGLAAGAMSMAAGEYVSVSSQADTERADLAREADELATQPEAELRELARIYQDRGLDREIATEVAKQLTAHDALGAHGRDELGISHIVTARPLQAAGFSAGSFTVGAILPLVVASVAPAGPRTILIALTALVFLALLGVLGARAGGASPLRPAIRITVWSAGAMLATALIGKAVGTVV